MATLDGITLNITEDKPISEAKIKRNPIAGTARTSNHNLGLGNYKWDISGFVKSEADFKALQALVGKENIVFVDKFSDSFNVDVVSFTPVRKPHAFMTFSMKLEEHS